MLQVRWIINQKLCTVYNSRPYKLLDSANLLDSLLVYNLDKQFQVLLIY
ncbi:unnamed protein product [Paramecium pentaurelia]|uniref:Uncharacterized protein n=1 Tax=Paramecium pentaurelia TaxID=43138 RepID=A0A8S1WD20_9CILI|nr:unnamed protein product [Paramecium pentaurelia]